MAAYSSYGTEILSTALHRLEGFPAVIYSQISSLGRSLLLRED
jgi:hypothetical protein